jgi:hypothetical protein
MRWCLQGRNNTEAPSSAAWPGKPDHGFSLGTGEGVILVHDNAFKKGSGDALASTNNIGHGFHLDIRL